MSDDKWVFIGVLWFAVFWILFIVSHPYFIKMKKNANTSNKLNSKKFNAFEVKKSMLITASGEKKHVNNSTSQNSNFTLYWR